MTFAHPYLLLLLLLLPLAALLKGRRGKPAAFVYSSTQLLRGVQDITKSYAGSVLLALRWLALALFIIALAHPRLTRFDTTKATASGVDIMLVLDMSWSMMALDMGKANERVSRMDIAQDVLEDFIQRRPDDRIGLLVFSAVPYLASPLTLNHDWLRDNLRRLHVGMIRELGTAIGDATAAAARRLNNLKDSKSRIIILLTDGDNNKGEIEPVPAAELAAGVRAKLYTIGIGKEEPCHLPAFDPNTGQLRLDPAGNVIPTIALQPANYTVLGQMSQICRGKSYRATNRRELERIYGEIDRLEKTQVRLQRFTTYTPLFQWPLVAGFALLGLEVLLANTRFRRVP